MEKTEAQALIVIRGLQEGRSMADIRRDWERTLRDEEEIDNEQFYRKGS